jgi:hypothetical protein
MNVKFVKFMEFTLACEVCFVTHRKCLSKRASWCGMLLGDYYRKGQERSTSAYAFICCEVLR